MKKISEFNEGEKIKEQLLVNTVNKGLTNNGAPYLSLLFQDRSATIEGKYWDVPEAVSTAIKAGEVYEISADVLKYKQSLQLRINQIRPLDPGSYNLGDFVNASKYDTAFLKSEINTAVESIQNPVLKGLVRGSIDINEDAFYSFPAASRNHHDFVGGLATHVFGMLKLADALCDIHPLIHRDLLIAGVVVHDIGKIVEYSAPILPEFTVEGKLIGHISMMNAFIYEISVKQGCENSEEALLLRHMVLSHHGEYEYGSPVLPMTLEAEMLNYIDNIDARINMLDKALAPIEPGQFTPRIFALENRSFYKTKLK